MKSLQSPILAALLLPILALTSCESPGEGAATGAMVGGAVGGVSRGTLRGAATGAAIGAGTGALIGLLVQEDRRTFSRQYDEQGEIPQGIRTGTPGFVESPYRPYNLIDVRGIPRGARVLDPSTDGVFINP